jgi:polyhydroxyalkanoate synthase
MERSITPKETIHREGTARLLRFRGPRAAEAELPILLVPSLINRWYVLDLLAGASVVEALAATRPTYVVDWGVPEDEDRYLSWDRILDRLARAIRRVQRDTGVDRIGLLGYCMGGTLAAIQAARAPSSIACLINLLGPIDFSKAGRLRAMVDARWFDAASIAAAGNVGPQQMQSGFVALRPTAQLSKWIGLVDRCSDPGALEHFAALESWANDNVPFPARAYETYIRELYQENGLVAKTHAVGGERIDLAKIECPVLTVVADGDTICPPAAARALAELTRSRSASTLELRGGHVGAVVGSRAREQLYPTLTAWLGSIAASSPPS